MNIALHFAAACAAAGVLVLATYVLHTATRPPPEKNAKQLAAKIRAELDKIRFHLEQKKTAIIIVPVPQL